MIEGAGRGFSIVVAMDRNRGIGNKGDLPWPKLKGDMRFFRELTTCPDSAAVEKRWGLEPRASEAVHPWAEVSAGLKEAPALPTSDKQNAVVMGRKTWESLPGSFRPLPERDNGILSLHGRMSSDSNQVIWPELEQGVHMWPSLESAIVQMGGFSKQVFVIGGGQIFSFAAKHFSCAHLYITEIDAEFECDTFFPETPDFERVSCSPWIEENGIRYRFTRWDRKA